MGRSAVRLARLLLSALDPQQIPVLSFGLADAFLAPLLPEHRVDDALALAEMLDVLLLAIELEKDSVLRPREVHARDEPAIAIAPR